MDNQKQQQQPDNTDSNKKESTNSGGNEDTPSTSSKPKDILHEDVCSICMDDVSIMNVESHFLCFECGKVMHIKCGKRGAIQSIDCNILEIDAFVCNEPESFRALNIPLGCEGEARVLAMKVLAAACGGGRDSIVQELFLKWNVKEDDDQNKEGETKRNDSMKKEKEKKRKRKEKKRKRKENG